MTKVSKEAGAQYYLLHPDKRGKMQLPVPIDEKAAHVIERRMAEATSERLALEAKKKADLSPINKRLAELRQTEKDLSSQRKSGQTMADVEVQERANFEEGIVWMVRLDTGMEVPDTRRAMTHAERQAFVRTGEGGELRAALPRRGEDEEPEDEEDTGPGPATSELGAVEQTTATQQVSSSQGAVSDVAPEPARSGAKAAKACRLTLPPPLHAYSAYRFAPVGAISIYQDGRLIGSARFDVKKDDLVINTGEHTVPKKVLEAIADACRFGELPIPDTMPPTPAEGAPTGPAPSTSAETTDEGATAAPLKLTKNDVAALTALAAANAPLSPEKIGMLTKNRRPGATAIRLQGAGHVNRLEGGLLEITSAGRAVLLPKAGDAPTQETGDTESEIPFG